MRIRCRLYNEYVMMYFIAEIFKKIPYGRKARTCLIFCWERASSHYHLPNYFHIFPSKVLDGYWLMLANAGELWNKTWKRFLLNFLLAKQEIRSPFRTGIQQSNKIPFSSKLSEKPLGFWALETEPTILFFRY